MRCPDCGLIGHMNHTGAKPDRDHSIELALNVLSRWRQCDNGHRWKTFELCAAELAELRRRAHLFERFVGSATQEPA
jgi:hypothetical protein